VVLVK